MRREGLLARGEDFYWLVLLHYVRAGRRESRTEDTSRDSRRVGGYQD